MSSKAQPQVLDETRKAMHLLGDDWVLCIVKSLAEKELRFCEIERSVQGINPVTLSDRLKKLEMAKIIKRKEETVDGLSVVYELTKKGRAILPIIHEIQRFAESFF